MKLTFKAIARAAGYFTYLHGGRFCWRNNDGWVPEISTHIFYTEEEAYKDCCIKCELVQTNIEGMVI